MKLEARAWVQPWAGNVVNVFLVRSTLTGAREVVTGFEFAPVPEGSMFESPSFSMSMPDAQSLIDELWNCGLRPSQGRQSEGITQAQTRHLEDMRAITFAKLSIAQPKS